MTHNQKIVEFWERHRSTINSFKGGWNMGKGVTSHGYSMLDELAGKVSFFQVLMLNVTGQLPDQRLTQWMEAIFICQSYPDPRIWCNQIGALGGDVRVSPVAAICAGAMAGDSKTYGPGLALDVHRFLALAGDAASMGQSAEEFVEHVAKRKGRLMVPGFARPILSGDERVGVMQSIADELGFEDGPHLKMAYEMEAYLYREYGESLNLLGYIAGFWLDQGLGAEDASVVFSMVVSGGIHACYSESRNRPPGSFLPLRCNDIEYTGVQERPVPRD